MATVADEFSLNCNVNDSSYEEIPVKARQRMRNRWVDVLMKLDQSECVSLVFLLLDRKDLMAKGHKYFQYLAEDKAKEVLHSIQLVVIKEPMYVEMTIEALYLIGRFDLLEDELGFCLDRNLHQLCRDLNVIEHDRRALFCIFSGLSKEETNCLLTNLDKWYIPNKEYVMMEEVFAQNLKPGNYCSLVTELHVALCSMEHQDLASCLETFINKRSARDSLDLYQMPRCFTCGVCQSSCYPHGLCLIINVKTYIEPRTSDDRVPLSTRHGSEIDQERLYGTFKLFGFHVISLEDPDFDRIQEVFRWVRLDRRLSDVGCLVVCVMAHGDQDDNIYLHDRRCIAITDLRKLCFSVSFIDKPRLFFIQACRGDDALAPVFLYHDSFTTQEGHSVTNPESDCLISAATVKGYTALRSQSEGSWYITDLCRSLQEEGHKVSMKKILQRTRQKLRNRVEVIGTRYVTQLSEDKDTLVKDVQLVRADEDNFLEGILTLTRLEVIEKEINDIIQLFIDTIMVEKIL